VILKEIRAKRETYANTMRRIVSNAEAESRGLTEAESRDFDGLKVKLEAISQTLDRASQLGEIRADIERPITNSQTIQPDGDGMVYGNRSLNPGEVRVFKPTEAISENRYSGPGLGAYVRGIVTGKWNGAEDLRALAEGSTPGSYLVPTPLSGYLIDLVRNQTQVVRAGAMTVPMESQTLKIGRLTSDVTSAWKAENAAMAFSDANFEVVTFTANTLLAGSKLSIEMVEDASNIDQIVMNSITQSLALALDYASLYGSGSSNQPKGIKNQTGVTLTSLGTNGLTLVDFSTYSAGISTLMGYNFNGPFGILHSARTTGELDNLQDTLRQPLRQPDMVAAAKKFTTNQIPNNLTQGSASTASDAFIGQWNMCMIGARTAMMLEVSRQSADSSSSAFTNGQVWIRVRMLTPSPEGVQRYERHPVSIVGRESPQLMVDLPQA
jgi:HK97 family phage major capsid protein